MLAALAATADPDLPVSTCPGWTTRQLFRHVGRGDRWAAAIVRTGEPADPRQVVDGKPPDDGLVDWLLAAPRVLLDAVASTGADTPVWTFLGPRPASWWVRRREHESTVHRADAALAVGHDFTIDPARAADGLSELLGLLSAREPSATDTPLADGTTLHLHATDDGLGPAGEWLVRGTAGGIVVEHGHGRGDVAVRGSARDLLLAATRRRPADSVEVLGEPEVWHHWLATTHY